MIEPYEHQAKNLEEIRDFFRRGIHSVLWYLPTGGGKSFVTAFMFLKASESQKVCWFIVHRRELLRQTEKAFKSAGIDYGVVAAGRPMQPRKLVQLCSINTLANRLGELSKPHLIAVDETHHIAAKSWTEVIQSIGKCYMVGLSASPCRNDGRGLRPYFGALVHGLSVRELIKDGFLSPFRTFAPPTVDTSGLHIRHGDYIISESEALMDKPSITGSAISEYRRLCHGKRAIVFCCSIEHSKHVAEQFRNAGYASFHIDGKTADSIRDMAIDDFEAGKIQVLCNVDLCGEGLSINAIECVILLRPTQSLALYIQQGGRGLRTWPGKKELIILDHVGSTVKFGMIDEPRTWTLEGDVEGRKKKKPPPGVRVCPICFAASSPRATECKNIRLETGNRCGYRFEVKAREVDEVDGELAEITADELAKKRENRALAFEQSKADTVEKLVAVFRKRGYKGNLEGHARHVLVARRQKKLR